MSASRSSEGESGQQKSNVVRILEREGIAHGTRTYESSDGAIDAVSVARKVNVDPDRLFKTLVARTETSQVFVFCIPGRSELSLKKAAAVTAGKSVTMVSVKELQPLTGYVRGGCSPIGMKKPFPVLIDETAFLFDRIVISGGRIGLQIEIAPEDLARITGARQADLTR